MVCSNVRGAVVDTTGVHCSGTCEAIPTSRRQGGRPSQGGPDEEMGPLGFRACPCVSRPRHVKVTSSLYLHGSLTLRITSARHCSPEAGPSGVRWPRDNPCFALPRQMPILGFWVPASWPPPPRHFSLSVSGTKMAENLAMGFSWDLESV